MRKLLLMASLLGVLSSTLAAQDSDPSPAPKPDKDPKQQSPDVLPLSGKLDIPEIVQSAGPFSPQEKALMRSAYDGELTKVEVLVAKGVSANLIGPEQRTPLLLAAYNGHTAVVEFLYGKGADIKAKDKEGQTALMYTCRRSFYETSAFLVKNGVEVNAQTWKRGISALMIAAAAGNTELVRLLLDNGADVDLKDIFGNTAQNWAEKKGHKSVVDLLSAPQAGG